MVSEGKEKHASRMKDMVDKRKVEKDTAKKKGGLFHGRYN
jgi:hypothetical protein